MLTQYRYTHVHKELACGADGTGNIAICNRCTNEDSIAQDGCVSTHII